MFKTIFIGGINRSGGSLLSRLFDSHPDVASYPIGYNFPINHNIFPVFESYGGVPMTIPADKDINSIDHYKLLGIPRKKKEVVVKWGKESSDPLGVRKNYLAKEFYGKVETDFDHDQFISLFEEKCKEAKTIEDLYKAKHYAYFKSWDNGKHGGSMDYVLWHASAGLYLTNINEYLKRFEGSVFLYPFRDIEGYIGSEKTRLTRRYYGSRRFPKVKMPNFFVKNFKHYDLDALIRGWSVALTRGIILQERLGVDGKFVIYRYENLISNPEKVMRGLCGKIGLEYNEGLLNPTIAGFPWGGSSHQGKQNGINANLSEYYDEVLTKDELKRIKEKTGPLMDFIRTCETVPTDLTSIPKECLFDYEYQKKYIEDDEKSALYCALMNSGQRRVMVRNPDFTAVIAWLYEKIIHLIHIPRLIKLKLFPGLGKQNYA